MTEPAGSSAPKKGAIILKAKGMKRQAPAVYSGEASSTENRDTIVLCPICLNLIESAYITECGHSFCHRCIQVSLEVQNRCPKCNITTKPDRIIPNFTLNEVIFQYKQKIQKKLKIKEGISSTSEDAASLVQDLLNGRTNIPLNEVEMLIRLLQQRKQCLELNSQYGHTTVTLEFLNLLKAEKGAMFERLQRELNVLSKDIAVLRDHASALKDNQLDVPHINQIAAGESTMFGNGNCIASNASPVCLKKDADVRSAQCSNAVIRQKLSEHSTDLEDFYISTRKQAIVGEEADYDEQGLALFTEALAKFVKFSSFRPLATLNYTSDMYNMYSIVSSIEFDRDADYFAIAGVTKKIKIYDYNQVVSDIVDMHYPIAEMSCSSKISCVAWNPYHKNELVSSDYEGTVTMWDPFTATKTHTFQEHEKRCWCVDFNRMNPQLLASGSDDSKVKIWSTNLSHSIMNIEAKANVCCVKFNPTSSFHLVYGSADHYVNYYDLRNTREPLITFKGHSKAVSYAKFLNGDEIVSASTDSQLKLWSVSAGTCAIRTFQGHINEKNFVGLAAGDDYIACGSEDNSLCVYYKSLTKMILKFKFDVVRSAWPRDAPKEEDSNEFVSAVSWRPGSNVVIVANSQGIVKVLELI